MKQHMHVARPSRSKVKRYTKRQLNELRKASEKRRRVAFGMEDKR